MINLSAISNLMAAAANVERVVSRYGDLARPDRLPKPSCKVKLVCGPPGAGKSTYVTSYASDDDTVIDIDMIAREHGLGRDRPADMTQTLLLDRNDRLAALATKLADHVAWVIVTAPSRNLRRWWCEQLNVDAADVIVLVPPRDELFARIRRDPDRKSVVALHLRLVDQWFARERENRPGRIVPGCDADGWPTDPLHSWNDEE